MPQRELTDRQRELYYPSPPRDYQWQVVFLNPMQGFRKKFVVDAPFAQEAIDMGWVKLEETGYDPDRFFTVSVIRGDETR